MPDRHNCIFSQPGPPLQIKKLGSEKQIGREKSAGALDPTFELVLDFAHFETMNSVYQVALAPVPIEAALPTPIAMCA